MTSLILAIFLAAGPCHAHTATIVNNSTVISLMDDTGGEGEHAPNHPVPPTPPTPPSPIPIP